MTFPGVPRRARRPRSSPCTRKTNIASPDRSPFDLLAQDVLPDHLAGIMVSAIRSYEHQLQEGALVTVDEARGKVRMLPIGSTTEL